MSRVTRKDKIRNGHFKGLGVISMVEIKHQPGWFERNMRKDAGKSDDTNNGRRRNRWQEKGLKRNC